MKDSMKYVIRKGVALLTSAAAMTPLVAMAVSGGGGVDSGCENSPENPTVILGLLGGVAAALPWARARIGAMRRNGESRAADPVE